MNAQALIEAKEKEGRQQQLMNTAYERWQKGGDLEGEGKDDFVNKLEDPYRMAVCFGNLNYQVRNGGFDQWIYNGYADPAFPYLLEYLEKYSAGRPGLTALKSILGEIQSAYEDWEPYSNRNQYMGREPDEGLSGWLEAMGNKKDDLCNAIGEENWADVDKILGGTDLDKRQYERDLESAISDKLNIETTQVEDRDTLKAQAGQVLTTGEGGPWYFKVYYGDVADDVVLRDSTEEEEEGAGHFATEDEAIEAAEEYVKNEAVDDMSEEQLDKIVEKVKDDLCNEYGPHVEEDAIPDKLNTRYYGINTAVMAELEQIFNQEWPNTPLAKLKAVLQRGSDAVTGTASQAVSAVRRAGKTLAKLPGRFKRAAGAAAKEFTKEDAARLVSRLLLEDPPKKQQLVKWTCPLYADKEGNQFAKVDSISTGGYTDFFVTFDSQTREWTGFYYGGDNPEHAGFYYGGDNPEHASDGMLITGNWACADSVGDDLALVGSDEFSRLPLSKKQFASFARLALGGADAPDQFSADFAELEDDDEDGVQLVDKAIPVTVFVPKWMTTGVKWRDV